MRNWENINDYFKKIIKGFMHENPGSSTYRVSMVAYGKYPKTLFNLADFDGDRKMMFDFAKTFATNEELVDNKNMFDHADLPEALGFYI